MIFWLASNSEPINALPGITRKVISAGERAMAVRFELAKGSAIPAHSHPHEQIGFVAAGKLRFTVGEETMLLEGGDGYAIPSNVTHAVEVIEDSVAIDVFSPVREEYLP